MDAGAACVDLTALWGFTLPFIAIMGVVVLTVVMAFWPRRKSIDLHLLLIQDEDGNFVGAEFITPKQGFDRLDEARKQRKETQQWPESSGPS